jgi:citrate synthase
MSWLTRDQALKTLRVRPQTLYAYVSRGRIGMRPDPEDPRRSLYDAHDIAALTRRRARGKRPEAIAASTIAWGEPIITTTISTISRGRLFYRGRDVAQVARASTLEQAAQLLWDASSALQFPTPRPRLQARGSARARAFNALAAAATTGSPSFGRSPNVLRDEAAGLVGTLASALSAESSGDAPVHVRLAAAWKQNGAATDLIRRALVLLADQELNSSSFAARVAASTGAGLGACVLAGLATLSGPLHGDATIGIRSLMDQAMHSKAEEVIGRHLASGVTIPGFGHPLYAEGDPRASALLAAFDPPKLFRQMAAKVQSETGQRPNLDFALVALVERFTLPEDAAFCLFALGRSVGWLAHAIEQTTAGQLIRPRARYVGPSLDGGSVHPDAGPHP